MADKRFNIILSATDRATAAIRKVNESFSRLSRPITDLNRATKSFSKEAGLDKIGKSLVNIGRASGDVLDKLTLIQTPLGAITSVGSVAGMAALEAHWANLGSEVGRTAQTLGISSLKLQSLRGAGNLAGVSIESMTSGLKSLGSTMEDALYGRNQQALVMMNQLGIRMHKTKDGAVDTARAFYELGDAIKAQKNPQVQALIARSFGMEDLLPVLRLGRKGIQEFEEQWKKTGAVMSPEQQQTADRLRISLVLLGGAIEGIGNKIALTLAKFQPWIDSVAGWIEKHQALTAKIFGVAGAFMALRSSIWATKLVLGPLIPLLGALVTFLATTPLGATITGLGILVGLAYELYQNWDAIWAKIKAIGSLIVGVAQATGGLLTGNKTALSSGLSSIGSSYATLSGASGGPSPGAAQGGAGAPGNAGIPLVSAAPAAAALAGGGSPVAPAPLGGSGVVNIIVDFFNAPRGMAARVDSAGGVSSQVRINHSMPSAVAP